MKCIIVVVAFVAVVVVDGGGEVVGGGYWALAVCHKVASTVQCFPRS